MEKGSRVFASVWESHSHSKLEILADDRRFLGALFRYTGDPEHPLSVFGKGTQIQRAASMAIFREALTGTGLSEEMRQLLTPGTLVGASGHDSVLYLRRIERPRGKHTSSWMAFLIS